MPQTMVHSCRTLLKTCVEYVVNNIDYWCNEKTPNEIGVSSPQYISSFERLPLPVLKEIIAVFQKNRSITIERYLKLFLTSHLDSLKLLEDHAGNQKSDNIRIINFAAVRCLHIKSLQIKGLPYKDDFMADVIPKFANLQVLNISLTSAGDITLNLLGKYCKNLRELIAENCSHITDAGMQGLCVSVDQLGKEIEGVGQCKLLEHLLTDGTSITSIGVKVGIRNLPKLKRWKMVSVQLLAEVYKEDFLNNKLLEIPKYSLIHLELLGTQYTSGSLGLVVSMCPSVTQVKIMTVKRLTDTDLQALLSLKNLHELEINGYDYEDECEITFSGGVTPILKTFGSSSLKILQLCALRQVNIDVIIQYCSNLHSLALDYNYHYSTTHPDEKQINFRSPVMTQLEKLDLSPKKHPSLRIPPENILSLFSIPSLKKISCWYCTTITDEILKQAARLHQFKNLESLELAVCASVTKNGINVLMDGRNAIKQIELNNCAKITDSDVNNLRQQATSNNWDLDIHYAEYSSEYESDEMEFDEVWDFVIEADFDSDIDENDD